MVHIKITKGLDIPIKGKPVGFSISSLPKPQSVALNFSHFQEVKFKLLVKQDDYVKIGQPLAEDKSCPGRFFVSPGAGVVKEIRRGLKRTLTDIIIELGKDEQHFAQDILPINSATREEIIKHLLDGGLFAHIRSRPFNLLANPQSVPKEIFIKAIETAPFTPWAELQIKGNEKLFQDGLDALAKIPSGSVHLVYSKDSSSRAFTEAKNVQKHTVEGPHPVANSSVHIHFIKPINSPEDVTWTLTAHDVVCIGHLLTKGKYLVDRVISIAGPGIISERTGYFKSRLGYPIAPLIEGRLDNSNVRLISGDPLMGQKVSGEDYMRFNDAVFCAIPEGPKDSEREFLHFFRLGKDKFTFSKAYFSGHLDNSDREYDFTTSLHGEHRHFIDSSLSQKVMPMNIPITHLVRAVMSEDYELADRLGLLEVDAEDFALPTFVCPSKVEMTDIIKNGLAQYAKEVYE